MQVVNWGGCISLLFGYIVLTLPNPSRGWRAIGVVFSAFGTLLVGAWAVSVKAWPVAGMELVFTVASAVQLWRMAKAGRDESTD